MTSITIKIPNWLDRIITFPLLTYRLLCSGSPYRRIYLDEGLYTMVDLQDYYRYGRFKWYLIGSGRKFYAVRNYKIEPGKTKSVYLHREIMNAPKGLVVDHRSGFSLDNRRTNLRLATRSQNLQNRGKTKSKTSSLFIGVSFRKQNGNWSAYISYEGKRIWLGIFHNEIDATRAYDRAAIKFHGEFAKLNFPKEIEWSPKRLNLRLANWLGARLNFKREDYINEIISQDSK